MADVMKFYTSAIGIISSTLLLDLRQSTIFLLLDTWRTAPVGNGKVSETFQVGFTGSDSTLRTNIETLVGIRQRVVDYFNDPNMNPCVVFQANSNGEQAKQALVYDFDAVLVEDAAMTPLLGRGHVIYQVSVIRDEEWDDSYGYEAVGTGVSANGGLMAENPASITRCSANRRIHTTLLENGPIAAPLYRIWIGIQRYLGSNSYSTVGSYFDASLEVEDGTAVDGSFVNDATASPSGTSANCLEVTSLGSTLTKTWWSKLNDHTATSTANFAYLGNWLVLARMKVDSGVVGMQLRTGVGESSATQNYEKINEIVYASNTSWRLIDLGRISIPPFTGYGTAAVALGYVSMALYLQQISGTTTSFKLDEIILIPSDYLAKLYKCDLDVSGSELIYVYEDWRAQAVHGDLSGGLELTLQNWVWPSDGGFLVVAAERETQHVLTDTLDITVGFHKRFLGYVS